jgi:hypothetical protein
MVVKPITGAENGVTTSMLNRTASLTQSAVLAKCQFSDRARMLARAVNGQPIRKLKPADGPGKGLHATDRVSAGR